MFSNAQSEFLIQMADGSRALFAVESVLSTGLGANSHAGTRRTRGRGYLNAKCRMKNAECSVRGRLERLGEPHQHANDDPNTDQPGKP
jgi:hypothetical protein